MTEIGLEGGEIDGCVSFDQVEVLIVMDRMASTYLGVYCYRSLPGVVGITVGAQTRFSLLCFNDVRL